MERCHLRPEASTNSSSEQAKVTIKKISSVKGYQIEYATNKDFKSSKKTTSTGTTVTLKSLSKGKTYFKNIAEQINKAVLIIRG